MTKGKRIALILIAVLAMFVAFSVTAFASEQGKFAVENKINAEVIFNLTNPVTHDTSDVTVPANGQTNYTDEYRIINSISSEQPFYITIGNDTEPPVYSSELSGGSYVIELDNSVVIDDNIIRVWHQHEWTYAKATHGSNQDVGKVTCKYCEEYSCTEECTFTLSVNGLDGNNKVEYGEPVTATLASDGIYEDVYTCDPDTVQFYKGSKKKDIIDANIVKKLEDVGNYIAAVYVYKGDKAASILWVKFEVVPKTIQVTLPEAKDLTYDRTPQMLAKSGNIKGFLEGYELRYAVTDIDGEAPLNPEDYKPLANKKQTEANVYKIWVQIKNLSAKTLFDNSDGKYLFVNAKDDTEVLDFDTGVFVKAEIKKANPLYLDPAGICAPYTGEEYELIEEGTGIVEDGANPVLYSYPSKSAFGENMPTDYRKGHHIVYYMVEESDNYYEVSGYTDAFIYDGELTPPVGKEDLVYDYNVENQELLEEEAILPEDLKVEGNRIAYAVSKYDEDAEEQEVPSDQSNKWKYNTKYVHAKKAGTYCVWYKAVDSNGNDLNIPDYILVSIDKAPVSFTWSDDDNELIYNGTEQVVEATASITSWKKDSQYSVDGNIGEDAGDYEATITLNGAAAANYEIVEGNPHEWSIKKKPVTIKWYIGDTEITEDVNPLEAVTYNGRLYIVTAELDGLEESDAGLVTAIVSGTDNAIDHSPTKYTTRVRLEGKDGAEANYELPKEERSLEWNIAKAPLTVNAVDNPITYGESAPTTFDVEYEGLKARDKTDGKINPGVVIGDFEFNVIKDGTDKQYKPGYNATGVGKAVYKIIVSAGSGEDAAYSNNYEFVFEPAAELTVNKRHVTFEWDTEVYEKTYDQKPLIATATTADICDPYDDQQRVEVGYVIPAEEGDVPTDNQATNVVDSKTIKAVIVNKENYNKKDNYVVDDDSNAIATLTINPISVYYEWTKDSGFVFNGQKQSLEGQFVGVLEGEGLDPVFEGDYEFYHADSYTTTITGATAAQGTDSNNYTFVTEEGTVVSVDNPVKKKWKIHRMNLELTWPEKDSFDYTGEVIEYKPTLTPESEIDGISFSFDKEGYTSGMSGTAAKTYTATLNDYDVVDSNQDRKAVQGDYKLVTAAGDTIELPATHNWVIVAPSPGPTPTPTPTPETAVQHVIALINALPNPATDADAAQVQAARDAYNALSTDNQKKVTNYQKLVDAEAQVKTAVDKKAADEVSALIEKLPDDPAQASEAEARAALAAYWALSDAQRALLSGAAKQKVAVYKYYYETQYAKEQKAKLTSVKAKKHKKATAKWEAVSTASGYQLYYKTKGKKAKTVNINDANTVTKTVKKLKVGKKYTFKVRTFNNIYNPYTGKTEKVYGKWSNKKKITAKK